MNTWCADRVLLDQFESNPRALMRESVQKFVWGFKGGDVAYNMSKRVKSYEPSNGGQ